MLAPLPVAEPDPVARLVKIARAMIHIMSRQRLVNLFTSNLPGPPTPMYLAGARVHELFQVGVVQGHITLAVGVLSYAGQLNFSILADADTVPDLKAFADGLTDALTQLGAKATADNTASRR
jgi:diacylglycerol O-acyltransferase